MESEEWGGGIVVEEHQYRGIPPRRSQKNLLHFLHLACQANQALLQNSENENPPPSLAQHFEELRRITRPGSSVFIISDFQGYDTSAERQLSLLARHTEVVAVKVNDPLEAELPLKGSYPISNGRQKLSVQITAKVQTNYQALYRDRQQQLADSLRRARISLLNLSTEQDPVEVLQQGFKRGMQLR